jgi:hypothetical protein
MSVRYDIEGRTVVVFKFLVSVEHYIVFHFDAMFSDQWYGGSIVRVPALSITLWLREPLVVVVIRSRRPIRSRATFVLNGCCRPSGSWPVLVHRPNGKTGASK